MNAEPKHRLGYASVWLGHYPSRDEFQAYFAQTEDAEGNVFCPFWTDVGRTIHSMMCETVFADSPVGTASLLEGVSFSHSFADRVVECCRLGELKTVNCGVVVFEFDYPAERAFPNPSLRFVGSFSFEHTSV